MIVAGGVRSKYDGQWHHITAHHLCELYGVDPDECYLVTSQDKMRGVRIPAHLPVLTARYDGKYNDFRKFE